MKLSEILINLLFGFAICCVGMFASATVLLAYPVVEIEDPSATETDEAFGVCGPINLVLYPSDRADDAHDLTICVMPIEALGLPVLSEPEQDG
ncbi:hypothetical protein [Yoonia sp. SS1-5]|uniref:Uncharacterized protein n=1 Tax=Yoonia rhodophyticola TaxID=3137370 RepID=A0AAN0M626_9RHOB